MNEFTREELEELGDLIHFAIAEYGHLSTKSVELYIPMVNKIQSMIDSYGEHEDDRN